MALNLRSVMLCYKYAAIQMIKQGQGGRIIGANLARQARVKVRKIFTKSAHVGASSILGKKGMMYRHRSFYTLITRLEP